MYFSNFLHYSPTISLISLIRHTISLISWSANTMTCPICLINCLLSQHWQRERTEPGVFNSSRGQCSHCQVQAWFLVSEMDYIQESLSSWQVSWLVRARPFASKFREPLLKPKEYLMNKCGS